MPIITLSLVFLVVAASFFYLGVIIGKNKQRYLDSEKLGDITLNFGGIYKIIDEYREMLNFFNTQWSESQEAVKGAFWICRIIGQHDQMLHQLLPLINKEARDKSRTSIVQKLPFCEVEWEGLTEVARTRDENKLSEIVEKASSACWTPSLSEEAVFSASHLFHKSTGIWSAAE